MAAQPSYTNKEHMEMLFCYAQTDDDPAEARRMWMEKYPDRIVPSCEKILELASNLKEHGSFIAPRDPNAPEPDIELGLIEFVEDYPHLSIREISGRFDVSGNIVSNILRKNNERNHNFLLERVELSPQDREDRVNYCKWMLEHSVEKDIMWADEALFARSNMVNVHSRNWWTLREKVYQDKSSEPKKFSLNVWAGIIGSQLIGPYFMDKQLKKAPYIDVFKNATENLMKEVPETALKKIYWYHHSSPPEHEEAVRQYLNEKFGERWIGCDGPVKSPTHCHDLIPTDYFLWRQVKREVYQNEIRTEVELREKIIAAFDKIRFLSSLFDPEDRSESPPSVDGINLNN